MILPAAGNAQIVRCGAEVDESVVFQDSLRPMIVQQRACLDPVQAQAGEGHLDHLAHGSRGQSLAGEVLADEVAQPARLERAAFDAGQGDPADDPARGVGDDVGKNRASSVLLTGDVKQCLLPLEGEVVVVAGRISGGQELAIAPQQFHQGGNVGRAHQPRGCHLSRAQTRDRAPRSDEKN